MKGIVIAGPTGVGKTELSIKLAKALSAEIISADSAQVYTGMNIGTAKITKEEMDGVKHHMLDIVEPIKKYSVGDYQKTVDSILKDLEVDGKNVILTGGTGLYINSITEGLSNLPEADKNIREKLAEQTTDELYEKLQEVDPEAAREIHKNNRIRVERALEVFMITGEKFSKLSKQNVRGNSCKFLKVALERDREHLYERINKRVEIMLEQGLLEEVKELYKIYGENLRKVNIIGYTEIVDFLEGKQSFEEAVHYIKQNSRRYAKRQFTWFKNDETYLWYDLDKNSQEEIMTDILEKFKKL
jgi:tRNA dimethylallyltransferase